MAEDEPDGDTKLVTHVKKTLILGIMRSSHKVDVKSLQQLHVLLDLRQRECLHVTRAMSAMMVGLYE